MTAITVTCVYHHFDSFRPVAVVFATEFFLVCLFKQFVDGAEMFSLAVVTAPSKVDYVLGLLMKVSRALSEQVLSHLLLRFFLLTVSSKKYAQFGCCFGTYVTYIANSRYPCELGAHVTAFLVAWHFLMNCVVVGLLLPQLVDAGRFVWLSTTGGYATFYSLAFICAASFATWVYNMADGFDRGRLWKRETGKDHFREKWASEEVWYKEYKDKTKERAESCRNFHPNYIVQSIIVEWLEGEVVEKWGGGGKASASPSQPPPPPEWMTKEWKDALIRNAKWRKNEDELERIRAALDQLPTYKPPVPVARQSSRASQRTKRKDPRVAPAEE